MEWSDFALANHEEALKKYAELRKDLDKEQAKEEFDKKLSEILDFLRAEIKKLYDRRRRYIFSSYVNRVDPKLYQRVCAIFDGLGGWPVAVEYLLDRDYLLEVKERAGRRKVAVRKKILEGLRSFNIDIHEVNTLAELFQYAHVYAWIFKIFPEAEKKGEKIWPKIKDFLTYKKKRKKVATFREADYDEDEAVLDSEFTDTQLFNARALEIFPEEVESVLDAKFTDKGLFDWENREFLDKIMPLAGLSKREKEVMDLSLQVKKLKAIAAILRITDKRVGQIRDRILKKLNKLRGAAEYLLEKGKLPPKIQPEGSSRQKSGFHELRSPPFRKKEATPEVLPTVSQKPLLRKKKATSEADESEGGPTPTKKPQGSVAECLRDLWKHRKELKGNPITIKSAQEGDNGIKRWRKLHKIRGAPKAKPYSWHTLDNEFKGNAILGFLRLNKKVKRPLQYYLTKKLLNLTRTQMKQICKIPELQHFRLTENKKEIKAIKDKINEILKKPESRGEAGKGKSSETTSPFEFEIFSKFGSSSYIEKFRDKIVVVKIGGSIMMDDDTRRSILKDIVFLSHIGITPVLIHGAGALITQKMKDKGIKPKFIEGLRVTDEIGISIAEEAFREINRKIVKEIKEFGGKTVGLNGYENGLVEANRKLDPPRLGFVGEVASVDVQPIKTLTEKGIIPVIIPMGIGKDEKPYNINADKASAPIASKLEAEELIIMTDIPGVLEDLNDESTVISTLNSDRIQGLIKRGKVESGMIPKVEASVSALEGWVKKVHIIDGRISHSLLQQILTDKRVGTEIIRSEPSTPPNGPASPDLPPNPQYKRDVFATNSRLMLDDMAEKIESRLGQLGSLFDGQAKRYHHQPAAEDRGAGKSEPCRKSTTPADVFAAIVELSKGNKPVRKSEIDKYLKIEEKTVGPKLRNLVFDLRVVKRYGIRNDATFDISFLDKNEVEELQEALRRHFRDEVQLKDGLANLGALQRKVNDIRKRYKDREVKPAKNQVSDEATKEDFRCFADRPTGKKAEITLRTGPEAGNLQIFRRCTSISLSDYPDQLVKVVAKKINQDLITIYVRTVADNKKVFTGSFIHSYNARSRKKNKRKVLSNREHYRLWFYDKVDVMPEEPLSLRVIKDHGGAYVFSTKDENLNIMLPATRDLIEMPDGSSRDYLYGRAAYKDGEKVLYVFFKEHIKDKSKACDWFRFEPPDKFVPSALESSKDIKGSLWQRITPKPGEPRWYRDIVKGRIVARERTEAQRPVKTHSGGEGSTFIYLWNDLEREKPGKYRTQNRSLGHDVREKMTIWLSNVPEEPQRLEILRIKGTSSLDNPNRYQQRVIRCYYCDETLDVSFPEHELIRRANAYFTHTGVTPIPDPIVVFYRPFGKDKAFVVSDIDGKKSTIRADAHLGKEILFRFIRKGRNRGVEAYLLDQFNRPFARLRKGWYNKQKKIIVWEKYERWSVYYLTEQEKQDLDECMWHLGYNPAPNFVVDCLKYIQNNIDKFEAMQDDDCSILVEIARILKGRELTVERAIEKLILMLPVDIPIRQIKEKLTDLAKRTDINPHYKVPGDFLTIEGLSDREIVGKMGMERLVQEWLEEEKPLNEVLFICQKAFFAQMLKFTQANQGNMRVWLAFETVRRTAEDYSVYYDDPKWLAEGAREILGKEIRIPNTGITMERFTAAIRNAYIDAALKKYKNNQELTRKKLKITIWELNDTLNKLGIRPDKEMPHFRFWGEAAFERHFSAFKKHRRVLFDFDMEKGKWYFYEQFKGRKIIKLAEMLNPRSSVYEDAITNIAILRILALLRKKDKPLAVKYVMPFFSYTCTIQDELVAARDTFWDNVAIEGVEEAVKVEKEKPRKYFLNNYLKNEAARKLGFMYFSALKGNEDFLRYAEDMVGILEKLYSEKLPERKFLNEMREKFDEAQANFDIYCDREGKPLPLGYHDKVEDLVRRFNVLKKGTSRISTLIATVLLVPATIFTALYWKQILVLPWKYIIPSIVFVATMLIIFLLNKKAKPLPPEASAKRGTHRSDGPTSPDLPRDPHYKVDVFHTNSRLMLDDMAEKIESRLGQLGSLFGGQTKRYHHQPAAEDREAAKSELSPKAQKFKPVEKDGLKKKRAYARLSDLLQCEIRSRKALRARKEPSEAVLADCDRRYHFYDMNKGDIKAKDVNVRQDAKSGRIHIILPGDKFAITDDLQTDLVYAPGCAYCTGCAFRGRRASDGKYVYGVFHIVPAEKPEKDRTKALEYIAGKIKGEGYELDTIECAFLVPGVIADDVDSSKLTITKIDTICSVFKENGITVSEYKKLRSSKDSSVYLTSDGIIMGLDGEGDTAIINPEIYLWSDIQSQPSPKSMGNFFRIYMGSILIALIALDQITKLLAGKYVPKLTEEARETLPIGISIINDPNPLEWIWLREALFLIMILFIIKYFSGLKRFFDKYKWAFVQFAVFLAGAVSQNMSLLFTRNNVIDCIAFGFRRRILVFNLADAYIALGAIGLWLSLAWDWRKDTNSAYCGTARPAPGAEMDGEIEGKAGIIKKNIYCTEEVRCNLKEGLHIRASKDLIDIFDKIYKKTGVIVYLLSKKDEDKRIGYKLIDEVIRALRNGIRYENLDSELKDIFKNIFSYPWRDKDTAITEKNWDAYIREYQSGNSKRKAGLENDILRDYRLYYDFILAAEAIHYQEKYCIVAEGNYSQEILKEIAEYVRDCSWEELLLEPRVRAKHEPEASALEKRYQKRLNNVVKKIKAQTSSKPGFDSRWGGSAYIPVIFSVMVIVLLGIAACFFPQSSSFTPHLRAGFGFPGYGLLSLAILDGFIGFNCLIKRKEKTLLNDTVATFRRIGKTIKLDRQLLDLLCKPEDPEHGVITVEFDFPRDDGTIMHLSGYCSVHNTARGAAKGGGRFHPQVTKKEVMGLSFSMTIKNAIVGIPFGGGKMGVQVDPRKLSRTELARLTRAFCRALLEYGEKHSVDVIGTYVYVPATDVGTDSIVAAWFADEYFRWLNEKQAIADARLKDSLSKHISWLRDNDVDIYQDRYVTQTHCLERVATVAREDLTLDAEELAIITNKPVERGGSRGRTEATGYGVFIIAREAAPRLIGKDLRECTIAVQGYGNVGSWAARFCHWYGAKVVAVSNQYTAIYNKDGIDIDALDKFIRQKQQRLQTDKEVSLEDFPGAEVLEEKDKLLELAVDISMPCALQNAYTKDNASRAQFRLQVPGANNPNTLEASKTFAKDGRKVIYHGLSNPGGATGSYLEWLQNLNNEQWQEVAVRRMLEERMVGAFRKVMDIYEAYEKARRPVSIEDAALILGISRVVDAMIARDKALAKKFSGKRKPYRIPIPQGLPETVEELNLEIEQRGIDEIVSRSEQEHCEEIRAIAQDVLEAIQKGKLPQGRESMIFVAGPLSVGKMTFANRLAEELQAKKINVEVFHIDTGGGESNLYKLLEGKKVEPKYNPWVKRFARHKQPLKLSQDTILIVEGDQKLTEELYLKLVNEGKKVLLLFDNLAPSMKMQNNRPLTSRSLRLMRRILQFCQARTEGRQALGKEVSLDILAETALRIVKSRDSIRQVQIKKAYNLWQYAEENRRSTFNAYLPYELIAYKPILWPILQRALELAVEQKDQRSVKIIKELQMLLGQVKTVQGNIILQGSVAAEIVRQDKTVPPLDSRKFQPGFNIKEVMVMTAGLAGVATILTRAWWLLSGIAACFFPQSSSFTPHLRAGFGFAGDGLLSLAILGGFMGTLLFGGVAVDVDGRVMELPVGYIGLEEITESVTDLVKEFYRQICIAKEYLVKVVGFGLTEILGLGIVRKVGKPVVEIGGREVAVILHQPSERAARWSFSLEEGIFSGLFLSLPWFLATLGFLDPSHFIWFYLASNILYGVSHTSRFHWQEDGTLKEIKLTTLKDKIIWKTIFTLYGAGFRWGYLIPGIGSILGPIIAFGEHAPWNNIITKYIRILPLGMAKTKGVSFLNFLKAKGIRGTALQFILKSSRSEEEIKRLVERLTGKGIKGAALGLIIASKRSEEEIERFAPEAEMGSEDEGMAGIMKKNVYCTEEVRCNLKEGLHITASMDLIDIFDKIYKKTGVIVYLLSKKDEEKRIGYKLIDEVIGALRNGIGYESLDSELKQILTNILRDSLIEKDSTPEKNWNEYIREYQSGNSKRKAGLEKDILRDYRLYCGFILEAEAIRYQEKYCIVAEGNYSQEILKEIAEYVRDCSWEELLLEFRVRAKHQREASTLQKRYQKRLDNIIKKSKSEASSNPGFDSRWRGSAYIPVIGATTMILLSVMAAYFFPQISAHAHEFRAGFDFAGDGLLSLASLGGFMGMLLFGGVAVDVDVGGRVMRIPVGYRVIGLEEMIESVRNLGTEFYRQVGIVREYLVKVVGFGLTEVLGLGIVRKVGKPVVEIGERFVAVILHQPSEMSEMEKRWVTVLRQELPEGEFTGIMALIKELSEREETAQLSAEESPYQGEAKIDGLLEWSPIVQGREGRVRGIEEFVEKVERNHERVAVIGEETVRTILAGEINPEETLFVVSYPGRPYEYVRAKLIEFYKSQKVPIPEIESKVAEHFIWIGKANTASTEKAGKMKSLRRFNSAEGLLVLLALRGVNIEGFLKGVEKGIAMCKEKDINNNPGAQFVFLQEAVRKAGQNRVVLVLPDKFKEFVKAWRELISLLGREGEGIIPILEGELASLESYGNNTAFITIKLLGSPKSARPVFGGLPFRVRGKLQKAGFPVFEVPLGSEEDIGWLLYSAEFAIVAGYFMGINRSRKSSSLRATFGSETGLSPTKTADSGIATAQPLSKPGVETEAGKGSLKNLFVVHVENLLNIKSVIEPTPFKMKKQFEVTPGSMPVLEVMKKIIDAEKKGNLEKPGFVFVSSTRDVNKEVIKQMLTNFMIGAGLSPEVVVRAIDSNLIIDERELRGARGIIRISGTPKISTRAVLSIINKRLEGRPDVDATGIRIITDKKNNWRNDVAKEMMVELLWMVPQSAREGKGLSTEEGVAVAIKGNVPEWLRRLINTRYGAEEAKRVLDQIEREGTIILRAAPVVDEERLKEFEAQKWIYEIQV
ncbi:MAG: acetylglutamate kinase [bacterium]